VALATIADVEATTTGEQVATLFPSKVFSPPRARSVSGPFPPLSKLRDECITE
jgi:hypothetical protein